MVVVVYPTKMPAFLPYTRWILSRNVQQNLANFTLQARFNGNYNYFLPDLNLPGLQVLAPWAVMVAKQPKDTTGKATAVSIYSQEG